MANVTGIGTSLGLNNFAKEGRLKSIAGTNALQNPMFDSDNGYLIGAAFNGNTKQVTGRDYYPAAWSNCSPIATNTGDYSSLTPTNWLADYRPFDDTAKFGGEENSESFPTHLININYSGGRVLKMYGIGNSLIPFNRNPDRTFPDLPVTNATTGTKTVDGTTTWGDNECWSLYQWSQGVVVPDGVTQVTFGAYFRCPPDDLFRQLNFGGCYVWQDIVTTPPSNVYVNAIAIKRASHSLSLRTGVAPSGQGAFNWSGLGDTPQSGGNYALRWNDTNNIQSITYKDAEDFSDFTAVTKTITLQNDAGLPSRIGFGCYFAENHSYLPQTPPDPNPPSGAIQIYNPFLIFSS